MEGNQGDVTRVDSRTLNLPSGLIRAELEGLYGTNVLSDMKEIIDLYDIYGGLLTEKQRAYFEDYYFLDLSLSEMAENYGISRNGVFDQIKRASNTLIDYENHIHLLEKMKKIGLMDIEPKLKEEILNLLKE